MTESKLSILPLNKTVVFYSPIEGGDVLVRTGTISEGSCFFHSILHACSKEYVRLDKKERIRLVAKLRMKIASKLDREKWEDISGGLVSRIPFQENVNRLLTDFYNRFEQSSIGSTVIKIPNDRETYNIITQLVTLGDFEKKILPSSYDNSKNEKILKCKDIIVNTSKKFCEKVFESFNSIEEKRMRYCVDKLGFLIESIVNKAESTSYKNYIKNIEDNTEPIDSYTIGLLSERFNRDIYFIDSSTRMPYHIGDKENIKKRKAIIIMWIDGIHYEIVGKYLPKNRIQRQFEFAEPLIQRIYTFLFEPENVAEFYPELIPHLPKEHQDRVSLSFSDSSSDTEN
jgi:hypothetical protein